MSSEPTLQQWEELYEAAIRINELSPWTFLWDRDLITLHLPDRDEPVFCSVMGRLGQCYGLSVYPGYESVAGYFRMANAGQNSPVFMGFNDAVNLLCFYGDREEVTPVEREIMKKLNLKFRGKGNWIYFRTLEPGHIPWYIHAEQAQLLIDTLQNLHAACLCLNKGEIEVDFEGGQTLHRSYDPEKKLWVNYADALPGIPKRVQKHIIDNELFAARLKQKKKTATVLELDMVYLPTPIREKKDDVPYFPKMVLLADHTDGIILDQCVTMPAEPIADKCIEMLERYITANGRPMAIRVRDDRVSAMVEDLCHKADMQLEENSEMPVINDILADMISYFGD